MKAWFEGLAITWEEAELFVEGAIAEMRGSWSPIDAQEWLWGELCDPHFELDDEQRTSLCEAAIKRFWANDENDVTWNPTKPLLQ